MAGMEEYEKQADTQAFPVLSEKYPDHMYNLIDDIANHKAFEDDHNEDFDVYKDMAIDELQQKTYRELIEMLGFDE